MSLNLTIFGICCLFLGVGVVLGSAELRLPGNNVGYEPVQPIEFSHRMHAGEMGIDCRFCHFGARKSRFAGVPPASTCMNCHKAVTAGLDAFLTEREAAEAEERAEQPVSSPELTKLYAALGLDELAQPDPDGSVTPIEWVRVHNLPDFVFFDHRPHVARKIACETCHGPVQSMERMRQESDLSMGWCVECHRVNDAAPAFGDPESFRRDLGFQTTGERSAHHVSTDCSTCHI